MSTRKKKEIRSLTKVAGGSFGITLPIELIRALGWRSRQKLTVKAVKGKKLVVKDWKA